MMQSPKAESSRGIESEKSGLLLSPKAAFGRLCRKLSGGSPKREENRSLTISPAGSQVENIKGTRSAELEGVFRYFDEDGDGKISPTELRSFLRSMGEEMSPEMAESVVGSSDSDGDGFLGFEDFVRLVEVGGEEEKGKELREAFEMYEMKGSGCITPKSLRKVLNRLGEPKSIEECTTMIRRYDLNGDGVISFDEFKLMML